jgi:hypothetical protein
MKMVLWAAAAVALAGCSSGNATNGGNGGGANDGVERDGGTDGTHATPDGGASAGDGATAGGDAGGDGKPISGEQACADLAASICNNYVNCVPYNIELAFGDAATCIAREQLPCLSALSANGSLATPARVSACAQARAAMSCDDLAFNRFPSACRIDGSLALGADCADDWQCAGANGYCKALGACGACAALGAVGAGCSSFVDCDTGLDCMSGRCVPMMAEGATCDETHACGRGTFSCIKGSCVRLAKAGDACSESGGTPCSRGLGCDTQTLVCAPLYVGKPGDACTFGQDPCAEQQTCVPAGGGLTGTCPAAVKDGASCNGTRDCLPPAVCAGGTCQVPDPKNCK